MLPCRHFRPYVPRPHLRVRREGAAQPDAGRCPKAVKKSQRNGATELHPVRLASFPSLALQSSSQISRVTAVTFWTRHDKEVRQPINKGDSGEERKS